MPWYSNRASMKIFYQALMKPQESLSQLHCSLLYWYIYPTTQTLNIKTRPRPPGHFFERKIEIHTAISKKPVSILKVWCWNSKSAHWNWPFSSIKNCSCLIHYKLMCPLLKISKMWKLDLWLLRSSHPNGAYNFWDTLYISYYQLPN